MKNWFNSTLQLIRKTGFGWGFILGGLLIGGMAMSLNNKAYAHDFKQGDLVIDHPYATPSLAGTRNGSVYFKSLRNRGGQADKLIAAKSTVAERVELHQMQMDGQVMRMREVPAIDCPSSNGLRQMGEFLRGEIGSLVLKFKRFHICVVVFCFGLFAL